MEVLTEKQAEQLKNQVEYLINNEPSVAKGLLIVLNRIINSEYSGIDDSEELEREIKVSTIYKASIKNLNNMIKHQTKLNAEIIVELSKKARIYEKEADALYSINQKYERDNLRDYPMV